MASGGWNTIESDAGVFTLLMEELGAKGVQFEELVSLDEESLEALTPVYGVIFLFKYISSPQRQSEPQDGKYDRPAAEEIFFAQQTIQNACGTQALLSVLLNLQDVDIGKDLQDFKEFASQLPPEYRGECLSNSEIIRNAHNSFARASPFISDMQRPRDAEEEDDLYHFIAYTPINGTLYELDGLQSAPISHGPCTSIADFPRAVIPVLQRRIARYPLGEVRFNLMAMTRDRRLRAAEVGDEEGRLVEVAKRRAWMWENALRRHNFVGFVGELTKGTVRAKSKGGMEEWIEGAKKKTRERVERRQKGGGKLEGFE